MKRIHLQKLVFLHEEGGRWKGCMYDPFPPISFQCSLETAQLVYVCF